MPTLSAQLMGDFSLALDGEPLFTVHTSRLQSLLAYLLLHRDSPISRDHLAVLFWPDSSEPQAHSNLRKLLSDLRTLLPCANALLSDGHTLTWNPDVPLELDVERFEQTLAGAGMTDDLQQTVELYRGDLLPGHYEEWIIEKRERLRQEYLGALEKLAQMLEGQGDYRRAIAYARRQLQSDPLSEETYRRLMRLSALSGNRAQVAWFHKMCITVLRRELGVDPSTETGEAYARCLDLAAQALPATAAAAASTARSAAHAAARPSNLPFPLTSLVGRVREREEVARLVTANRLVTLTGPPGVGKTRLAIQVAADVALHARPGAAPAPGAATEQGLFRTGAWLVELAPLQDPGSVLPAIARVFSVSETERADISEPLKQFLRDKEVLLVLDNFEHVCEAAGHIGGLLASCPRLRVLATSRVPLRLSGEHEYPVHPLPIPALEHREEARVGGEEGLAKVARYDAVRLFVERAQAVLPSFDLNKDNASPVAQVCARLDGLPLAIELAAPRIRMFSPQVLLDKLERSLQLLTGGARDLPERHRTLRSAIEWSYELLSVGEQQLFRRMAVLHGGGTMEALEAVCSGQDVLDQVESLIEQSLVETREGRHGEPRFWMLETIHEFALEKLAEADEGKGGECEEMKRQHARYFLALAEEAGPQLAGPRQREWLDRLEDEHENLRAAMQWAAESEEVEDVEAGLRAATALRWFWILKVYHTEGRTHLRDLLAKAARLPGCSEASRANALNVACRLTEQGDLPTAQRLAEEALRLAREAGDRAATADALRNHGNVARLLGSHRAARSWYEESLAMSKDLDDKDRIAAATNGLGAIADLEGDYSTARALYEESLALQRELGDRAMVSWQLFNLANLATMQGDFGQARPLYEESLAISKELGDRGIMCSAIATLGDLAAEESDYVKARTLYEEGLAISREVGIKDIVAQALVGMGNLARVQGDPRSASTFYDQAAELDRVQADEFNSLYFWGLAAGLRGECAVALALHKRALSLSVERGLRKGTVEALAQVGADLIEIGQIGRGVVLLAAAVGLIKTMGVQACFACRVACEQATAAARAQLGDEEFQTTWQQGQAMNMQETMEYSHLAG